MEGPVDNRARIQFTSVIRLWLKAVITERSILYTVIEDAGLYAVLVWAYGYPLDPALATCTIIYLVFSGARKTDIMTRAQFARPQTAPDPDEQTAMQGTSAEQLRPKAKRGTANHQNVFLVLPAMVLAGAAAGAAYQALGGLVAAWGLLFVILFLYLPWPLALPTMAAEGTGIGEALRRTKAPIGGSRVSIAGLFAVSPLLGTLSVALPEGLRALWPALGWPLGLLQFPVAGPAGILVATMAGVIYLQSCGTRRAGDRPMMEVPG
jgi:uncharacterized MAPEG superfamily protein